MLRLLPRGGSLLTEPNVFQGFFFILQETLNNFFERLNKRENDSQFLQQQETKNEDAQSSAAKHVSRTSQSQLSQRTQSPRTRPRGNPHGRREFLKGLQTIIKRTDGN